MAECLNIRDLEKVREAMSKANLSGEKTGLICPICNWFSSSWEYGPMENHLDEKHPGFFID